MDGGQNVLKWFLVLEIFVILNKMLAFGIAPQEDRKCKYARVEGLLKIRCYDMNLKEVPKYLKSSVEVLDLSYNRIRKLHRHSFQPYGSIKFLLLYENMIQFVERDAFSHLHSLQEIDLSNNALTTIPLEIFQLPSLRNLYADSNDLIYLEQDLEHIELPIAAPLEYLNLANCGLRNVPNLGILPKLWHINVSSNPLTELSIDRFSYMCNLKSTDFTSTQMSECLCQQINSHLRYLGTKLEFVPVCKEKLDMNLCPLPYNQTIHSNSFEDCKTSIQRAEARSMWLFVTGCFGGVLTVILLVCFCMYRQRKKRINKQRKLSARSKSTVISPKNIITPHKNSMKDYRNQSSKCNSSLNDKTNQDQELLNCDNF